jgi:hypothetical protein
MRYHRLSVSANRNISNGKTLPETPETEGQAARRRAGIG